MDPKAFLDRWSHKPTPSPELAGALGDLARLGFDRPELASPASTLKALLAAAFHPPELGSIKEPDLASILTGWAAGRPAFQVGRPILDNSTLVARSRMLAEALGSKHEGARDYLKALRAKRIDLESCVNKALAGRPEGVAQRAEAASLDPALLSSILRLTLLPSLARFSSILDKIRPEGAWDQGDCPHCGSRPLLAESRGLEQRIVYRCGLCAGGWPGERLRCPSCGENSSKALHYSYVEGEQDRYRLAHCEACLYDWKVVSTLTALSPPAMIVADLATVHLDVLAGDRRGESP